MPIRQQLLCLPNWANFSSPLEIPPDSDAELNMPHTCLIAPGRNRGLYHSAQEFSRWFWRLRDMSSASELQAYLDSFEDLTYNKDRGILKKVIKEGSRDIKPCTEDTVVVHYVGTYFGGEQHGEQFDSSRARNKEFEFTIGKGEVIKAWDVGVATMKVGEVCELIAAPEYGYNDGKTMKFEIELFDTKGMDVSTKKDGSVRKSVLDKGRDILTPTVGLDADISYRAFGGSGSQEFRDVSYTVGDLATSAIPECVDLAVRCMHTGERSLVRRAGLSEAPAGDVANGMEEAYEVRLRNFEKAKRLQSLTTFAEQISYAETLKSKANDYLKTSKFDLALSLYERLHDDLQYIIPNGVEEHKILTGVITAVRLNMALVYLKLGDANNCSEKCNKILETDPSNEKALFRLGQACLLRKDHEDAVVYFRRIVQTNPNNTAAAQQLRVCEEAINLAKEKERKMFRGVYERFKETGLGAPGNTDTSAADMEKSAA
ncbi:hypothetical protein CRM22_000105 [Opisthorchis felineus]|uniref:peptidylprolyl isomerase n=1 Tax=Opisthorchis felineus TaxID=147828 RepID=A0A4S2MN01_OPIFE|nr:hypothetical protein CRM22_000105 [Opisthorchis felineus]